MGRRQTTTFYHPAPDPNPQTLYLNSTLNSRRATCADESDGHGQDGRGLGSKKRAAAAAAAAAEAADAPGTSTRASGKKGAAAKGRSRSGARDDSDYEDDEDEEPTEEGGEGQGGQEGEEEGVTAVPQRVIISRSVWRVDDDRRMLRAYVELRLR